MELDLGREASLLLVVSVAASVGFLHTLAGPDHYLPFVALRQACRWSKRRTFLVTLACGFGHCASSVLLAFGATLIGATVMRADSTSLWRGDLAAGAFVLLGIVWIAIGLHRAKNGRRLVLKAQESGQVFDAFPEAPGRRLGWSLFLIFVLGPCEWLVPASLIILGKSGWPAFWLLVIIYSAVTMATMLGTVFLLVLGVQRLPSQWVAKHAMTLGGGSVLACGLLMFLGL